MPYPPVRSTLLALTAFFLTAPAWAALSPFSENFESLNAADTAALGNAGWKVFGNVFSGVNGGYLYGYGPFPAPNTGAAFSAIVSGEGGPSQGAQQLSVFSDYNNVGAHSAGDRVEANVYQERTISAADVGTWQLSFDAKRGNITGATTAIAFIKTLDPAAGFQLTNFILVDLTGLPSDWQRYSIAIDIDAGLANQLLQFGFANTASNFEGSGVFYDNVDFARPAADSDGDGVADNADNCTEVVNANQRDADNDGIGSLCDSDLDNNCSVNFGDLGLFKAVFFTADEEADFDDSGSVNFGDLGQMKGDFFLAPGPSGIPNVCDVR